MFRALAQFVRENEKGQTLQKSALKLFTVAIYIINSVDNTKLPSSSVKSDWLC